MNGASPLYSNRSKLQRASKLQKAALTKEHDADKIYAIPEFNPSSGLRARTQRNKLRIGLTPAVSLRKQITGLSPKIIRESVSPIKRRESLTSLLTTGVTVNRMSNPNPITEKLEESLIITQKADSVSYSSITPDSTLKKSKLITISKREFSLPANIKQNNKPAIVHVNKPNNQKMRVISPVKPILSVSKSPKPAVANRPSSQQQASRPPEDKIPIRELIRERGWLTKAKDILLKSLSAVLRESNGLAITSNEIMGPYKYYIGKGNNASVIKNCMSGRPGWVRIEDVENILDAHFVWAQSINKSYMDNIPIRGKRHLATDYNSSATIELSLRFSPKHYDSTSLGKPVDISELNYELITSKPSFSYFKPHVTIDPTLLRVHNKLEAHFNLSDKKALFMNLKQYYSCIGDNIFNHVPLTFHIVNPNSDSEFQEFLSAYDYYSKQDNSKNFWIIKPGENSNRGNGISVCNSLEQIRSEMSNPEDNHTFIVQKYIEDPLLIHKRKFDIRCYALVTHYQGLMQGYFYLEGYLRTTCREFTLKNAENLYIHLTNDAVQKKSDDYGKFENGNKMSYGDFQRYLMNSCPELGINFTADILPRMKELVQDTMKAVFLKLNPENREMLFEVYGYDFLIDSKGKPWLIEVNTNPCLETSSPILARVIPSMIENALRIALDPIFPEPCNSPKKSTALWSDINLENKFELIFNSHIDGQQVKANMQQRDTLNRFLENV